jgi:hypothetical protein
VIVRSPRRGYHLYYRMGSCAVRCHNLRHRERLAVDIKADGGLVIAPPSHDLRTGRSYAFLKGTISSLRDLPIFPVDALGDAANDEAGGRAAGPRSRTYIPRGHRNDHLFQELLKCARHCDDFDALLDVAQNRNAFAFEAPLPDDEVISTAKSAWRYECEGRNWAGRSPRTILSREELLFFAPHKKGGDALMLWSYLEGQHARRAEPLVLDRIAMTEANLLPGWSQWRYRQTIKTLLALGLIEIVGGGHRRGDQTYAPYQYCLKRPMAGSRQDTTKTVGGGPMLFDEFEP